MTPPLMLQLEGRDVLSRHPDTWPTLVGEAATVLLSLPCPWRLVTVATPTRLRHREQATQDALALTTDPQQQARLHADLLFYADLARSGMTAIQHHLLVWTADPALRQSLPARLTAAMGQVTVLERWPMPFGPTLHAHVDGLTTPRGSWVRGLLSRRIHGRVLPTLWRDVLSQPFPVVLVLDAQTTTTSHAKLRLETARHHLEAHPFLFRGFSQDRENAQRDWAQASSLVHDGQFLHDLRIAVFVQGGTAAQVQQHSLVVQQAMAGTVDLVPATGRHHALLPSITPTAGTDVQVVGWNPTTQPTPQVAAMLPIYLTSLHGEDGILFGIDRQRNAPLWYNPAQLDARNACFFGWTGSGKSSYVAILLHRLILQQGVQGIVLDPQGAFGPLAAWYPGSLQRVSLGGDDHTSVRINPLDLIVDRVDSLDAMLLQILHVEQVLAWFYGQPWSPTESVLLQQALQTVYTQARHADGTIPIMPRLRDVVAVLAAMPQAAALHAIVAGWTDGPFGAVLDQWTTLDLTLSPDRPLIIYDVSDAHLPAKLKHTFLLLITSAIQRAVRTTPRDVRIVIDEAGVLFNDPLIAQCAEVLAKTIRRYGGALWIVDQTLNLLQTKSGDEVFQNSAVVAIGTLQVNQHALLGTTFPQLTPTQIGWTTGTGLTDRERAARRGHFLLMVNGSVYPIYNALSTTERALLPQAAVVAHEEAIDESLDPVESPRRRIGGRPRPGAAAAVAGLSPR